MKLIMGRLLWIPAVIFATGCATIVGGSKHLIVVNSNITGAEVVFNGQVLGTTPFTGSVPKRKDAVLLVQKKGYRSVTIGMNTATSLYFWGNILSTYASSTGSTVDFATGNMWEYSPNTFYANLEPEKADPADHSRFQIESRFRRFVLYNFDSLNIDLAHRSGEYLDAFYEVLPPDSKEEKMALIEKAASYVGVVRNPTELLSLLTD